MISSQPAADSGSSLRALVLLVLLLGAVFFQLQRSGRLEAERVADTPSYMEASRANSLTAALSAHRTIGFPTLIRSLYRAGSSTQAIPSLQVSIYFLAVVLLFHALRRFTGSTWLAFFAVIPLPFAGVMRLVSLLQPDFLSAAFALISIACLLLVVINPRHWPGWVGVGLGVPFAYQFRPASQFLVVLVPIFAGIFLWLRYRASITRVLRLTALTAAVTVTPFLLFCTLRVATVGNFGLVSFGGSNLAATVVNFLDTDLIGNLQPESRDLATRILKQRRLRGWQTMQLDSDPVEYFRQANDNLWEIARPIAKGESRKAARRAGSDGTDHDISINVDMDKRLTHLATQIIRLRPALYLNWIRNAFTYGLRQLANYAWIYGTFLALVLSLPIAWIRRRFRSEVPPQEVPADSRATPPQEVPADSRPTLAGSQSANLMMLASLAVGYFVVYLLLVSSTFFPFDRYFVSMTLFIPSALVAGLYEVWRRILQPRQP